MIYFFYLLHESVKTNHVFLFEIFTFYVFTVFLIKYIISRKYQMFNAQKTSLTNSVVIPVYNELPELFDKSLKSISLSKPDEIIVVIDVKQMGDELYTIAKKYTDKVFNCKLAGKRNNLIYGVSKANGDIIISVDSDTVFTPRTVTELMKPFAKSNVGGVTTRQHIINPKRDMISIFCQWMEDVRFSIGIPAQSVFGSVGCLPGRAIAFRKNVFTENKDRFLNQTFMGFKCESGDDRVLTSYALQMGYDTVYQSSSIVYTDCPDNWSKFVKQQLRWSRSSQRETISSLGWLWKRPYTLFQFATDILTPFLFVSVVINMLYSYINGLSPLHLPLVIGIPMALLGMNLSLGIRQYPHLINNLENIKYLPIYVLFMTFVMTPIRIIGFFTMYHSGWMTRNKIGE